MSPEDFIRKHITAALEADLLPSDAIRGVERALDYYRRMSQASRKGPLLMIVCTGEAVGFGPDAISERKSRKKANRNNQHGLF
jgi:hypothetical protein